MTVVPGWINKKPVDHEGSAKVGLANEAIEKGLWIYDKTTRLLYTPTEFVWDKTIRINVIKQHKADMSNFELRDPRKYIEVRKARIKQLVDEIEDMERRIFQYYKLVPKKI
ncbi:MAG: hypothetical protein AAGB30_11080 [Pedobacter sp.]